jgi:class 3 adenylate cyclase
MGLTIPENGTSLLPDSVCLFSFPCCRSGRFIGPVLRKLMSGRTFRLPSGYGSDIHLSISRRLLSIVKQPRLNDPNLYPEDIQWLNTVKASWTLELSSNSEALWPLLADTSSLNRRLGLPEMEFEERGGHLFGSSGRGLFRQEWVEIPWEWEVGKWLVAERRYRRGFARAVRVRYHIDDYEGGTRLTVSMEWIPRSRWSRPILKRVNLWLRGRYERAFHELDELAGKEIFGDAPPLSRGEPEVDEGRIQRGIRDLAASGFFENEIDRLADYIRSGSDEQLFRIRPKQLAFEWGMQLQDLLALLLQSTRAGLLRLSWDVMCPHCQGVRKESSSLGDLRELGRCDVCDIDFSATSLEAIEVSFRVLPEIRVVREIFYCSAEPAKRPHIFLQRQLEPGESYETRLTLFQGRYRIRRALGKEAALSFEVRTTTGAESLIWHTNDSSLSSPLLVNSRIDVKLVNPETETVAVVVEKIAEDPTALRPSDLFNLQQFRDLFSEESIASGLKLEVGHQTLLFSDIVGSTQLYRELGDTNAFNVVHAHFVILQEIIGSKKGAVVKTIGDATMAAFHRPEDALEAAVEIQQRFSGNQESKVPLTLRISLHRGICLAVRLQANIDYFGDAVNYAAKMQSVVSSGQIGLSEDFVSQPGISESLKTLCAVIEKTPFSLFPNDDSMSDNVTLLKEWSPKNS